MPQDPRGTGSRSNSAPEIPRPALAIWQSLESERIRWEGQVLIVGQEGDLPALLVMTGKRIAFIANNEIALEFPLNWMKPEPRLVAENGIRLFISPDGNSQVAQPMLLRARAGRAAAAEIAAVLTGRTFSSRATDSPMHIPEWKDKFGASPSVALPQLGDDATTTTPKKAAWPPSESSGISSTSSQKPPSRPKPSADIAPWRAGSDVPKPRPVPTDTSRTARLLGTSEDGYTVTEHGRDNKPAPARDTGNRKHRFPMWLLNVAIVALLVTGFGYVAHDRGYGTDDLKTMVPGNIANFVGIDKPTGNGEVAEVPEDVETDEPEVEIREGGDNRLLPVINTNPDPTSEPETEEDESASNGGDNELDSIGGASQLPVTESVSGTPESNEDATEDATEEPAETEDATEEPVETEEATEEPEVTEEATEEPTSTEVATEEPEVTEEATEEPAETEEATEEPVDPTIDPTAADESEEPEEVVEPTPEPTVAPTQEVTLEQPASVEEGSVPSQAFAQGGIRYNIDAVATGASIDALPEVNTINGTWVVITLTGINSGDAEQTFDMSAFTLVADGESIELDTGTGWVSSLLGNDPAYGNTDTATWAPGEQHQFTLTFRAPSNVESLTLMADDQQIALDPAITNSVSLNETARDEAPAATLTGTVTEVIDGETIVVDIDGESITVRYLGIEAPTGEACFADESTLMNAGLVEGAEVTLERQSVDTNARGVWVRDVWVTDDAGNQVLVSQALVSEGAATSKVSEPNSRYAGWLNSTEQEAQNNEAGLWSACGDN